MVDTSRADLASGDASTARAIAAPLYGKHADLPAIQSLRCDIAMKIGGDWAAIDSECAGLSPFGAAK